MGMLKKIQYNCRQATFLLEKKAFKPLSFYETIELRIHLAGCSVCRLYGKQSAMINDMVQQLYKDSEKGTYKLNDSFKKELQLRIEEELNK
ncbi:hypothetical protein KXQ82_07030 [Mucilaginibacter sp. HMF5004]|uniref:hypothetical protein n=1 Tax=Mucilaginibacter rivuli TaxID=2857527 RepID=UPI001C5E85DC|nr:hypothetical protein [Mucilaginibacter rivuli]MBW4889460.1 hypothetical protein [Mucilaginibacter rivuli]